MTAKSFVGKFNVQVYQDLRHQSQRYIKISGISHKLGIKLGLIIERITLGKTKNVAGMEMGDDDLSLL